MAKQEERLKEKTKSARSRVMLILIVVILLVAALFIYLAYKKSEKQGILPGAQLTRVPQVQSIPGAGTPSEEYVKKQQEENVRLAQEAARTGKSAVPTITRTGLEDASEFTPIEGAKKECDPEELRRARQAGVKAEELRCKGCSAASLKAAGYTAGELMNAGYSAKELKDAGFTADELKAAGFTAAELARASFSAGELAAAGFTPAELAQAGISEDALTKAGVTPEQLKAAGVGTKAGKPAKDCNIATLKRAKAEGVPAAELRKMGCGAAALKAAGYTAKELKDAGFNPKELKDAGFSAADLKKAGFSAGELRQAGFSPKDLANAGFTPKELRDAGFSAEELKNAGLSAEQLKAAGFSDGDLTRAGVALPQQAQIPTPGQQTVALQQPARSASAVAGASIPSVEDSSGLASDTLSELQKRQAAQLSASERQDTLNQMQTAMTTQATELFASWSPPPTQQYIQGEANKGGQGQDGQASSMTSSTTSASAGGGAPVIIKAGTVMYGTLDTAINSDETSPILATIVLGDLKGTKLVGSFNRADKKVVVKFEKMNIPSLPNSVQVDAVAIDPNTARTAMASDVDNHYLLRYGTLFASAFVSGLSDAISESGSTTVSQPFGTSTTTNPTTSSSDKALIALGEVGKQYSSVLGANFTRPPTVMVDAGSPIGVLFMSDVTMNAPATTTTVASTTTSSTVSSVVPGPEITINRPPSP